MNKWGRGKQVIVLAVFIAAVFSVTPAYSNLTSTFNSDAEGWTLVGATGPTWLSTGGNPGGYIQGVDNSVNSRWSFITPNGWNGNWSGYIGGSLQFDLLKTGATGTETVWNVVIYNGSNYAVWDHAITPTINVWNHYSVDLTSSNFDRIVGAGATFESIMSNVTALYILGDYGGDDTGGLDNVQINAVPIPAAVYLLGSGLLGLVAVRRRFKK
jgi:hypothetical protein